MPDNFSELSLVQVLLYMLVVGATTGGGGAALVNAITKWRQGKAQKVKEAFERSEDAEDKHFHRLDHAIDRMQNEINQLKRELNYERHYNAIIVSILAQNGLAIPDRESIILPHKGAVNG